MAEIKNNIINFISKNLCNIFTDPFKDKLSNYAQIESYLKLNTGFIMNYIYFSRKKIHKILYDEEQRINIKYENEKKKNLSYYFYLNLLINENPYIINYSYSIELIENLYNNNQKEINGEYNKIFFAKIIIDLVNNYKQLDEYNEEKEEKTLNKIKNKSKSIINKNLSIFKEINLNLKEEEIVTKKIDELYSEIIISLIINRKFEDYDFAYNIINQLDLENIDITQTIFNSLKKILDKDEGYMIKNKEDLLNKNNINFYYILLKYIFKNSIYIYQIPLLLELKKFILKNKKEILLISLDKENKFKFDYILSLLDLEYYYKAKISNNSNKNNKNHPIKISDNCNNEDNQTIKKSNSSNVSLSCNNDNKENIIENLNKLEEKKYINFDVFSNILKKCIIFINSNKIGTEHFKIYDYSN